MDRYEPYLWVPIRTDACAPSAGGCCVRRKPLLEQLAACILPFPATAESDQELEARELKPRTPAAGTAASLHSTASSARARACSPLPLVAGLAFQSGARTFGGARRSRDAGRPSAGPHSRAAAVTYTLSTHRQRSSLGSESPHFILHVHLYPYQPAQVTTCRCRGPSKRRYQRHTKPHTPI